MLRKAATLAPDEVVIDLEDGVAPQLKTAATRRAVILALRSLSWTARTLAVRVNAVGTPWCLDDLLEIVGEAGEALHSVIVPKVESARQIYFVGSVLDHIEESHRLKPLCVEVQIESPLGLVEIKDIATSSPRIEALIFGPGDFAASASMPQLSIGTLDPTYPGDVWHYPLSCIATTAHAFGMQAIDGPFGAIRDLEGLAESARRSRALGFDGKWVLHPAQIDTCSEIYAPSQAEFNRATRILDVYRQSADEEQLGVTLFQGEMIDEASRKMARSVIERGIAAGLKVS